MPDHWSWEAFSRALFRFAVTDSIGASTLSTHDIADVATYDINHDDYSRWSRIEVQVDGQWLTPVRLVSRVEPFDAWQCVTLDGNDRPTGRVVVDVASVDASRLVARYHSGATTDMRELTVVD